MPEVNTGVFNSMQNQQYESSSKTLTFTDERDPETIYNLLFRNYDEENRQ